MKTPIFRTAVAVTLATTMGASLPASALAQTANSPPGYWASDGNYYYYPTPAPQNQAPQYQGQQYPYQTPSRPGPFTAPPPNQADYLAKARAQALADYQRDLNNWQAQRDANDRAIAEWDARYGRPPTPVPVSSNCDQRRNNNTVTGGILGALVGAAIGSNLAARNTRTEGAVLGGVVGAALGANIGKTQTSCDAQGYYYTYDQTYPYQEPPAYQGRNSGQHDYSYYNRQRCRLAMAPTGPNDYRYVRVCPDSQGRYRITG